MEAKAAVKAGVRKEAKVGVKEEVRGTHVSRWPANARRENQRLKEVPQASLMRFGVKARATWSMKFVEIKNPSRQVPISLRKGDAISAKVTLFLSLSLRQYFTLLVVCRMFHLPFALTFSCFAHITNSGDDGRPMLGRGNRGMRGGLWNNGHHSLR